MSMFLNYHDIADNYTPNNLIKAFPQKLNDCKLDPVDASKPYEDYNVKGELIGYFWRYGETLNLEFNIDGEVTVESDAILYKASGQKPTTSTKGRVGQKLYNIIDLISWTCVSNIRREYVWQQDAEFTYPLNGDKSVYVTAADYLADKQVEVTLYNFRMEPLCKKIYAGSPQIIFSIDRELSCSLPRGIYYCSVKVFNDETMFTIFDVTDGSLTVK